jgi:hypothetical protein
MTLSRRCFLVVRAASRCHCRRGKGARRDGPWRRVYRQDQRQSFHGRGRNWLPREAAADRPGVDDRDPSLCQMSDGTLVLFAADYLGTSNDNGKTWDIENEIVLRMDGGTPQRQHRKVADTDPGYPTSIQLDEGLILTVCYMNTAGSDCFVAGTFWRHRQIPETRRGRWRAFRG